MKFLDRSSIAAGFAAVLTCCLAACSGAPADREPVHAGDHPDDHAEVDGVALTAEAYEVAGIAVAPVGRQSLTPTVRVTGTLSYDERHMAIATARVGGRISRVVADYGERVAAGQVLAWIDSPELGAAQAEYRQAVSMLRLYEAEYERAERLAKEQVISTTDLLRHDAEWRGAQADLEESEQHLYLLGLSESDIDALAEDRTDARSVYPVRASVGGVVTERDAVAGRVADPEDELFTVAEIESLWLFLRVFEKDLHSVAEGATVTLTCESHPEERFHGTIDVVGQVLDEHSRTVSARAVIDNPDRELKPGMFVYASIAADTGEQAGMAQLAVPVAAVAKVEGRDVVFVQTGEHEFELRPVVVGESDGEWFAVQSGLMEGESIAVAGVFVLKSEVLKGGLEEHQH